MQLYMQIYCSITVVKATMHRGATPTVSVMDTLKATQPKYTNQVHCMHWTTSQANRYTPYCFYCHCCIWQLARSDCDIYFYTLLRCSHTCLQFKYDYIRFCVVVVSQLCLNSKAITLHIPLERFAKIIQPTGRRCWDYGKYLSKIQKIKALAKYKSKDKFCVMGRIAQNTPTHSMGTYPMANGIFNWSRC